MYSLEIYDGTFFSNNQAEGLRHAKWFVPLLIRVYQPASLVDIGCGTGHFVERARALGIAAHGFDGASQAIKDRLCSIGIWDLRTPLHLAVKYDLAICIEVAEHIEPEYAGTLVDTLTSLSETVVMTAATPGQGGLQHVNEQPRQYWVDLFERRGYVIEQGTELFLRKGIEEAKADGHHVASWFENIIVFRKIRT